MSESQSAADVSWKGPESLRPLLIPIESLQQDPRNARLHPQRNLDAVRASLAKFGQRKPVVHRAGVLVAGNGTQEAAKAEGWTHLAAVDANDLSEDEARAYGIADNQTGVLAEWDFTVLAEHFASMPPELLDTTGFKEFERAPLLAAEWKPPGLEDGGVVPAGNVSFVVTADQAKIIRGAIAKVREIESEPEMPEGRALELVCAEFLSGN